MKLNLDEIKGLFEGKDKKKIIGISVLAVILIFFDFYFILGAQIKAYRNTHLKIKKLIEEFKSFKTDLLKMQSSLKEKKEQPFRIISESELSLLIEELSNLANRNNLEISLIKPNKDNKPPVDLADFSSYLIQLNLKSNYYHLLEFLKNIEENRIFMSIESLDISQNPKDIFKHNINLTLRTYVKK